LVSLYLLTDRFRPYLLRFSSFQNRTQRCIFKHERLRPLSAGDGLLFKASYFTFPHLHFFI
jgi:hypothetical protein